MAKGFAIHNAPTDHGGLIPATQFRDSQMGNAFVRAGDGHFCPKCKCWSTVIKSHDHVIIDGKPVAYVGDKLTCGARIQPQQSHVVGDSGSYYGNSSSSNSKNNFIESSVKKDFNLKFQVNNNLGQPVKNAKYMLIDEDGEVVFGTTSSDGYTSDLYSDEEKKFSVHILLDDTEGFAND